MPYSRDKGPKRSFGQRKSFGSRGGPRKSFGGPKRSFGGPRKSFGPREMHKIKCSECGKEAEVPFKPRPGTPVYCKECFMKRKGITPRERKESPEEAEKAEEESKEEF